MSATEPQLPPATPRHDAAALLDKMRWTAEMSAESYGVRFGIRSNELDLLDTVLNCLSPGTTLDRFSDGARVYSLILDREEPHLGRRYVVFRDRVLVGYSSSTDGAYRLLGSDAQLYVAEMAPERVFIHAGVVGWRGRAIIMPGRSFVGKSKLVLELVRAGAEYYSDEYAVIDAAGRVHPYPRALCLRADIGGPGAVTESAECLRRIGTVALRAGLVLVCQFQNGGEWRPERLTAGAGALALLANTVSARRMPDFVMATLCKLVADAPIVAGERGEAAEVVRTILDLAELG